MKITKLLKQRKKFQRSGTPPFGGRGRERALWILAALVSVGILQVLAQILSWPLIFRIPASILAVSVPLIVSELKVRKSRESENFSLLAGKADVLASDLPPRIDALTLAQLRIHPAQVSIPYIDRDKQSLLEAELAPGSAILVIGHSMAGKSRMVFEALKRTLGASRVLIPTSGTALQDLMQHDFNVVNVVVLLDDLERFFDGLSSGLIDRIVNAQGTIVATIRASEFAKYEPQDDYHPYQWDVLQKFTPRIHLARMQSNEELARVEEAVDDPKVVASIKKYGLGEYIGAGRAAVSRFLTGQTTNILGWLIVRITIDWRRAGFARPIDRAELKSYLYLYVDALGVGETFSDSDFAQALDWATQKINKTVCLVSNSQDPPTREPTFEAFDYLVDYVVGKAGPYEGEYRIPRSVWDLWIEGAKAGEVPQVASGALECYENDIAEALWRRALAAGNREAYYQLGILLMNSNRKEEAKSILQTGAGLHNWDAAAKLGEILCEEQDYERGVPWLTEAVKNGSNIMAMYHLGLVVYRMGGLEVAEVLLRRAWNEGQLLNAATALARVLQDLGKEEEAQEFKAIHERAVEYIVDTVMKGLSERDEDL